MVSTCPKLMVKGNGAPFLCCMTNRKWIWTWHPTRGHQMSTLYSVNKNRVTGNTSALAESQLVLNGPDHIQAATQVLKDRTAHNLWFKQQK